MWRLPSADIVINGSRYVKSTRIGGCQAQTGAVVAYPGRSIAAGLLAGARSATAAPAGARAPVAGGRDDRGPRADRGARCSVAALRADDLAPGRLGRDAHAGAGAGQLRVPDAGGGAVGHADHGAV